MGHPSVTRRIAVITGSRAEYGLLRWLAQELSEDPRCELQLVVTGMHLSTEFGLTYRAIEDDGFVIAARVDMLLASDEPRAIVKSVGLGTIGFADAFERLRPDMIVLLGDRFEMLCAAQAALLMRIPVAHIHGGEISEGAIDDSIRHTLTKMAQLHFVSAEEHRRRVVQLGEEPGRVFAFGAPGLDAIRRCSLLDKQGVEDALGIGLGSPVFLVTYHPATLGDGDTTAAVAALCGALERFPGANVVITKPNADANGRLIAALLERWAAPRAQKVVLRTSLGQRLYLSALRLATVVIGNSSSGIIEAPAMGVPTVNIGPRQDGRLKPASVIDCAEDEDAIVAAIHRALSEEHAAVVGTMPPPLGADIDVSRRIADVLLTVPLDGLVRKRFFDVSFEEGQRGP